MSQRSSRCRNGSVIKGAVALTVAVVGLAACAAPPPALDLSRLGQARIEGIEPEPILLENGSWEGEPWVEGGAARPRAGLIEEFVLEGSFTGEGRQQAAVLLWNSGGGSGTRLFVAVLEAGEDRPHSVATSLVGDRVQVIDFVAEGRELVLDLVTHGAGDAACCPGEHELRRYRFAGESVMESAEDLGRATARILAGQIWKLDRFAEGQDRPVDVEITIAFDGAGHAHGNAGCNDYEATVEESDGRNLTIHPTLTTMRRCPKAMVGAESEFLRLVGQVARFSFQNGRLVLQYTDADQFGMMSFTPAGEPAGR